MTSRKEKGMEATRVRRGRVAAGKRVPRPVEVRYRTYPILTQEQEEAVRALPLLALMAALIAFGTWLEGTPWPA